MEKTLADVTATEEDAIKTFEGLSAAKTKEIEANTAAIESKLERVAQVGLEITEMKEDLDDATKEAEWAERTKTRADELLAISDTIKILNDDDALELFKKTLPSASLLQTEGSARILKRRALAVLDKARANRRIPEPRMDFIALALQGKSGGTFDKVIGMIDEMVAILAEEQKADDEKKVYCESELDKMEDQKKSLERKVDDLGAAIDDAKSMIETLTEEIESLADGIKALDKSVAEATENRKAENVAYKELMAADTAAEKLLSLAGNRLAKFYTPKLYVAEAEPTMLVQSSSMVL